MRVVAERQSIHVVRETAEASRAFLQERLSLFGRWFFTVALGYYLISNFPTDLLWHYKFDWATEYFGVPERLNLGIVAAAAIVWLATRGHRRPLGLLHALDAFGIAVPLLLLAGIASITRAPEREVDELVNVLLASVNIIVVRAIVVPSTALRTFVVSAVPYVPVVAAIAYVMYVGTTLPARSATDLALSSGLWGAVAIAGASVTSRILFHLRTEVAHARKLGPYTLEKEIGRGAMGVVYRAQHALLHRPTAIKLLAPGKSSEADLRRFEREVRLTAGLTHPNTIAVYDFGRSPEGIFYYAMELVDGISLEELVRREGPQPPARVVSILRQACGALDEAHHIGLIHRDIKPANIMLCARGGVPDTVKVLDYGLVRALAGDGAASAVDAPAGSPLYMSPEAIDRPATIDRRSDIYALGAVGYFLLTGTPVFTGSTYGAICGKHLAEAPEPPSRRLGRPIPAELEAIVLACLAKQPSGRPASAAELARRLAELPLGA